MEFNLTNILLSIIAIAISVIAIKFTVTFDINEYLRSRKNKIDNQIKSYCTHVYVSLVDDSQLKYQSVFISPSGTISYVCKRCGLIVHHIDDSDEAERIQNLLKNPEKYYKQENKFKKLLKKGGYI